MWYRTAAADVNGEILVSGSAPQILGRSLPEEQLRSFGANEDIHILVVTDDGYARMMGAMVPSGDEKNFYRMMMEQAAGVCLRTDYVATAFERLGWPLPPREVTCIIPQSHATVPRMVHEVAHVLAGEVFPEEKFRMTADVNEWGASAKEIFCEVAATRAFRTINPSGDFAEYLTDGKDEYLDDVRRGLQEANVLPPQFMAIWTAWNLSASNEVDPARIAAAAKTISSFPEFDEENMEDGGITGEQLELMADALRRLRTGEVPEGYLEPSPRQPAPMTDPRALSFIENLKNANERYQRRELSGEDFLAGLDRMSRRIPKNLSPEDTEVLVKMIEQIRGMLEINLDIQRQNPQQ